MSRKSIISCLAAVLLPASATFAATLADWTFETSAPALSPGAGVWITNIAAEVPTGTASGLHAGAAVYSSPAGNGSSHSFSSTVWAVGDFYQFAVSTTGAQAINVTFAQTSSGTGPGQFQLKYGTDGVNFTAFGSPYTVQMNASPNPAWNSTTASSIYDYAFNLSAVTAINNAPVVYFRLVDNSTTSANGGSVGTVGSDRVDNFMVTGSTGTAPVIASIGPSSQTVNAGNPASFKDIVSAGDLPLSYFWYKITGSVTLTTNLISAASETNNFYTNYLDLANVTEADAASYQVVVSNATGINANSAVVSLAVNDPAINQQPVSQTGLLGGAAQFYILAGGTGLSYQWYFSDVNGNLSQVNDLTQADGSVISGSKTSTLLITNLQTTDPTNFAVVVTGTYSPPVTSSVVSLNVATNGSLAYWTFNGNYVNVTNPVPYLGVGTASSMNVNPFLQTANQDGSDPGLSPPNNAWGTSNYPASGLNKQAGVQFNTSTVGAKDINVSFDIRATTTASKYQRLQYTTDGSTWIDYPVSQTFAPGDADFYESAPVYNLTGFPGVDNNPNFGVRLVAEFESTARYNDTNDNIYVGMSATYAPVGTISYDIVNITADAITDNNQPPVISSIPNQKMGDMAGITVNFTVTDVSAPASSITFTASCLDPNLNVSVNAPVNTGGSVQLGINSGIGGNLTNYAPILIIATDANGNEAAAWFTLEIDPANLPPTISGLVGTNMLPNCVQFPNNTLVLPFTISDDHTAPADIAMSAFSGNTTLLSNASGSLSIGGLGTSNLTLIITPNTNQEGAVPITVSATDGGGKTTSVTNYYEVRPNTNVVLIDYFGYDNNGSTSIVTNSGGLWQTTSGIPGQLSAGQGVATIDGVNNTEDVNAQLIGEPYPTNSPTVLYSSYVISFTALPDATGSFDTHFKDSTTSNFYCRVWGSTTGAASGDYRLGITKVTNTVSQAVFFQQDLALNSNYVVVTRLVLSNGYSTLWINPSTESSSNVMDSASTFTFATNISAYCFRESSLDEGILNISKLRVGLTFDSVYPSVNLQPVPPKVIVTWSDPTLNIQTSTNLSTNGTWTDVVGATSPYTNNNAANPVFYKFGQ